MTRLHVYFNADDNYTVTTHHLVEVIWKIPLTLFVRFFYLEVGCLKTDFVCWEFGEDVYSLDTCKRCPSEPFDYGCTQQLKSLKAENSLKGGFVWNSK